MQNKHPVLTTVKIENGKYQANYLFDGVDYDLGILIRRDRRWHSEKNPDIGHAKTMREAAYKAVNRHILEMTNALLPQIRPLASVKDRKSLRLTEEQAHAVWDVLVRLWNASPAENDRDLFVKEMTKFDCNTNRWVCGLGCFRQKWRGFDVAWLCAGYSEVLRYRALVTDIALQDLYIRFFG